MMRRTWIVPTLATALSLAACSNVVMTNDPVTHPSYFKNVELYAARGGSIRVEVEGDTFGLPREEFADRVVATMRAGYYRHDMFTREASRATDPRFKIVMSFNVDPSWGGNDICAASQPIPPVPKAAGQRNTLFGVFCGGTLAISENAGWVALSGVDDPNFTRLVNAVTESLFGKTDIRDTSRGGPGPS